jgi:hypothetical protein
MTTFCNDPDFLKRNGKREGERNRPPTDPDDETLFAGIKSFAAITAQPRTSSSGTSPACCHRKTTAPRVRRTRRHEKLEPQTRLRRHGQRRGFLRTLPRTQAREFALYQHRRRRQVIREPRPAHQQKRKRAYAINLRGSQFNLAVLRKLLKRQERPAAGPLARSGCESRSVTASAQCRINVFATQRRTRPRMHQIVAKTRCKKRTDSLY